MNAKENKGRPSITSIFVLLVIVLFATGSGWNHYQTNKKISSLLIENSTLQDNYQLEISTLEAYAPSLSIFLAASRTIKREALISALDSAIQF